MNAPILGNFVAYNPVVDSGYQILFETFFFFFAKNISINLFEFTHVWQVFGNLQYPSSLLSKFWLFLTLVQMLNLPPDIFPLFSSVEILCEINIQRCRQREHKQLGSIFVISWTGLTTNLNQLWLVQLDFTGSKGITIAYWTVHSRSVLSLSLSYISKTDQRIGTALT